MTGVTGRLRKAIAAYAVFFLLFKFSSCSLTALYEASISKYLFRNIFEPIGCLKGSCWNKGEVGHRFIQSTVRSDLLFFLFPTEYRVVLHCGKSELDASGRRQLLFKPITISMHMVLWEIAINASLYRCLNRCQFLKRTDFVTCLHSRCWFAWTFADFPMEKTKYLRLV